MLLTVLSVAYPHARVGRDAVGGAEQVLSMVDRALVAAGHRSLVIAAEGSRIAGELIALPETRGPIDDVARARAEAHAREPVDVVHLHGIDCAAYLPDDGPTLVTLHLPLDWYPPALFEPRPDLLLFVDSFPYVVLAGEAAVAAHWRDAARALRPGGALAIYNYAYCDDPQAAWTAAAARARSAGLRPTRAGERPFRLWDGAAYECVKG